MDVTVKRSEWYRGQGSIFSRLYTERGRCCLGFAGNAAGWTDDQMKGISFPHMVPGPLPAALTLLVIQTKAAYPRNLDASEVTQALARANDRFGTPEAEREAQITELGLQAGINFTFID